jgi:hypothetical protein
MNKNNLSLRLKEFTENVWDHSQDPFQMKFDKRVALTDNEQTFLAGVLGLMHNVKDDGQLCFKIFDLMGGDSDKLLLLIQLCGLTRNKIITDLKAAATSSGIGFPSSYKTLVRNREAWIVAWHHISKHLFRVLGTLSPSKSQQTLEAINQATWLGFVRQERAKRMGHEGENRLAVLLSACKIAFVPKEKLDNPICPDVQIFGVSFDLVVPDIENAKVCVKSTVHTSNIGQYGESKDHLEIDEAKRILDKKFATEKRPILLALIDGIGFRSNRAGLEGVLSKADEFCQFRTIWKAVVICSHTINKRLKLALPSGKIALFKDFLGKYGYLDYVVDIEKQTYDIPKVNAGEGVFLLEL